MAGRPKSRKDYSADEIDVALTLYATMGDLQHAAALAGVHKESLRRWARDDYRDRFDELRVIHAPQVAERIAGVAEELILGDLEIHERAQLIQLTMLREGFDEDGNVDVQSAKRATGIHSAAGFADLAYKGVQSADQLMTKISSPIRGRPTATLAIDMDPADKLARIMEALGVSTDSTAEELPA